MAETHELMEASDGKDPQADRRLNDTDIAIIKRLQDGRETTKSLADQLDKHPQTIRDRLAWLKEWGYVRTYHETTGLHELDNSSAGQTDK